ncbi:MAG TPA: hypothetical protein VGM82_08920 [Gemmatimonadaceae bacterium]|jgi:hypothetical protein
MHPAFQRYMNEERWPEAKAAFESDTTLMNQDWALLVAARLYSSPTRGAYDPARARALLQRLLARNPQSKYRDEATDRLALIDGVVHERDSLAIERRALDDRITQLTSDARRLRVSLDSAIARNDTLQRSVSKMELDLRDREDQLRALRVELARLKQIDLNPRPAARPPQR